MAIEGLYGRGLNTDQIDGLFIRGLFLDSESGGVPGGFSPEIVLLRRRSGGLSRALRLTLSILICVVF